MKHQRGSIELILVLIIIVALAFAVAVYFLTQRDIPSYEPLPPESERVNPAPAEGEDYVSVGEVSGTRLIIDEVSLSTRGFVVVFEDSQGSPSDVLGVSELLSAGMHSGVAVSLSRSLQDEVIYAYLYTDDGDGEFSLRVDKPTLDEFENEILEAQVIGEPPVLDTEASQSEGL